MGYTATKLVEIATAENDVSYLTLDTLPQT